ncbi:MAG: hypothetical protein GSR84_03275, partial [Desulfurococcales archaeon]|nr:hypothetical protein [Desulfurococcales archaeon]
MSRLVLVSPFGVPGVVVEGLRGLGFDVRVVRLGSLFSLSWGDLCGLGGLLEWADFVVLPGSVRLVGEPCGGVVGKVVRLSLIHI